MPLVFRRPANAEGGGGGGGLGSLIFQKVGDPTPNLGIWSMGSWYCILK